jgi:hypothetical protein
MIFSDPPHPTSPMLGQNQASKTKFVGMEHLRDRRISWAQSKKVSITVISQLESLETSAGTTKNPSQTSTQKKFDFRMNTYGLDPNTH